MRNLELRAMDALRAGRKPSLDDFGGLPDLAGRIDEVAASRFAPDLVAAALEAGDVSAERFAAAVAAGVRTDLTLLMIVDRLADRRPLSSDSCAMCFGSWSDLAWTHDAPVSLRTAALRGALLMAGSDEIRSAELSLRIAKSAPDDDPDFLAHAARIGGRLHARDPSRAFLNFIGGLRRGDAAEVEASVELGWHEVAAAFEARDRSETTGRLRRAHEAFSRASVLQERHDAKIVTSAIDLLFAFESAETDGIERRVASLRFEAFAYASYAAYETDFLTLPRATEVAAWSALALTLSELGANLARAAWLEARRMVEGELITAYQASRSVFRRSADGGLEWLVRPRIDEAVARNAAHRALLQEWADTVASAEGREVALAIIAAADARGRLRTAEGPSSAAAGLASVAAGFRLEGLEVEEREFLEQAILGANALMREAASPPIVQALREAGLAFGGLRDFKSDAVRALILAVVHRSLVFLASRLDATPGQDSSAAYLFKAAGDDPHERELQADFMRFVRAAGFGAVDELRGVGGGRADVAHTIGSVRFVTEVKREFDDASFEALLRSYGDQAGMYQATNIPFGMMLVLDLAQRPSQALHISTLQKAFVGDLLGDGVQRGLFVIKIPGRRISPSDATKAVRRRVVPV